MPFPQASAKSEYVSERFWWLNSSSVVKIAVGSYIAVEGTIETSAFSTNSSARGSYIAVVGTKIHIVDFRNRRKVRKP